MMEPKQAAWTCRLPLGPDPAQHGLIRVDKQGQEAETAFRVVASAGGLYLIEARPATGRQHQIRLHLAESGCPIVADELYGEPMSAGMGLRAVGLAYRDPFTGKPVAIRAPVAEFLEYFGFAPEVYQLKFQSQPLKSTRAKNSPLTNP